jgi:hypothetical protein
MPLCVGDVSAFARTVCRQLDGAQNAPSHVEMLNLLARAGGFRNFQHLRAQHLAQLDLAAPPPAQEPVDYTLVKRLVRLFDAQGRLVRWPKKFTQRMLCLWVLWSRIPARQAMSESEINDLLDSHHGFGDCALLRRELADRGLVNRTPDGRRYTRIEQRLPATAAEVIRQTHR